MASTTGAPGESGGAKRTTLKWAEACHQCRKRKVVGSILRDIHRDLHAPDYFIENAK